MNYFSDILIVSIVLVLLFGSIAWYLYTCIRQTEQKNSLLESIVLNLKMDAEMKSYSDLPADDELSTIPFIEPHQTISRIPTPVNVHEKQDTAVTDVVEPQEITDTYSSIIADAVNDIIPSVNDAPLEEVHVTKLDDMVSSDGYESMSLKELQSLAKSRNISGTSTMKKAAVIEALRTSDHIPALKSGSGASSLMDHSEVLSFE